MDALSAFVLTLLATLAAIGILAALARRRGSENQLLRQRLDEAGQQSAALRRLLRLAADEVRLPAMVLRGHAERLGTAPGPVASGIAGLATQMLALGDELQDQLGAEEVHLREEPFPLAALLDEAIIAVGATLGPSARHFKLDPGLASLRLYADRRAMRHILTRVLASAARYTSNGDRIDIRTATGPGGFVLTIADEGAGIVALDGGQAREMPSFEVPGGNETRPIEPRGLEMRGLGLGLALARRLVLAHGGMLTIESRQLIGTEVAIRLPGERLLSGFVPGGTAREAA